jgi:hypothetical protein
MTFETSKQGKCYLMPIIIRILRINLIFSESILTLLMISAHN